jgi:hypothetical protein
MLPTKYNQGNYIQIDTASYQKDSNRQKHSYENLRSNKIQLLENTNPITMQYTAKQDLSTFYALWTKRVVRYRCINCIKVRYS